MYNLLEQYDIGKVYNYKKISGGLDLAFMVVGSKGKYILKILKNQLNTEDYEQYVLQKLKQYGMPVSEIISNKFGRYISQLNDIRFHLQRHINGKCCDNNTVSQELLNCSAKYLAKINIILNDMVLPNSKVCNLEFDDSKCHEIKEKHFTALSKLKENFVFDNEYSKILSCLEYRLDIIYNEYFKLIDGIKNLSLKNSHGDYSFRQILVKNKSIEGIIDFSRTSKVPISWELIRSYTISSYECKNAIIDFNKFNNYIRCYENVSMLTKNDKLFMPNIYILQLLSSLFGLNEYLEHRDKSFIQLFYWRTKFIKFLIENRKSFIW